MQSVSHVMAGAGQGVTALPTLPSKKSPLGKKFWSEIYIYILFQKYKILKLEVPILGEFMVKF